MSSVYPAWWDATVTLYNRYEDTLTHVVTWHRRVLTGCFWKYAGNKVRVNNVTIETDNTICRIRKNGDFLERWEWARVPNDQMDSYFTLAPGDVLVKGEVDDEVDEYAKGKRMTDLLSKYRPLQGCIEIQEVAINVGGGRNNEHYFVSGV